MASGKAAYVFISNTFRPASLHHRLEPRRDETLIMRPYPSGQFLLTKAEANNAEVESIIENGSNHSLEGQGMMS